MERFTVILVAIVLFLFLGFGVLFAGGWLLYRYRAEKAYRMEEAMMRAEIEAAEAERRRAEELAVRAQLEMEAARSNRSAAPIVEAIETIETTEPVEIREPAPRSPRLDRLENDPGIVRSILAEVDLSLEIESAGGGDRLVVRLEKPDAARYLVDSPERSCILYVDNRPWKVLHSPHPVEDTRELLDAGVSEHAYPFPVPPGLRAGAALRVEWVNYNPRTDELERLMTESAVLE